MKLARAKEILRELTGRWGFPIDQDTVDALNLSIEALKQIQVHRTFGYPGLNFKLPGETEE